MTDIAHFISELPSAKIGLGRVLADVAAACKEISRAIDRGALAGTMGSRGEQNVQGEEQKKLDVISNDVFIEFMQRSGLVSGLVSEEMEASFVPPGKSMSNGKDAERYLVLFDPLDGSSNVDANISVGSIFSILRCPQDQESPTDASFLQAGAEQLCAGYAIYGSSTMLVLTVGDGVQGFTLDRDTGAFVLTHPDMRISPDTHEFAINISNYRFWESPMQNYIDDCLQGKEGRRGRDFNMRWIASMVAEIHRILIRGGIFIYPVDSKNRKQGGRLRLLYEANPMSFIVEQAGGMASTGRHRIMDIAPDALHQRVAVVMGSKNEVETLTSYYIR